MDVTSSRAASPLQPGSQTAPILRDPAQLLQMYAEHDRSLNLVSTHISSRIDENRAEGGVIQKAVFLRQLKIDARVVGAPGQGIPPKGRGLRDVIRGDCPSNRSLANVGLLLGNCEPSIVTMVTATMSDLVHALFSVAFHRQVLRAFLESLRRRGFKDYVWVREYQQNGSVHWHIFLCVPVDPCKQAGDLFSVDIALSEELSKVFTGLYAKKTKCPLCRVGEYEQCEALKVNKCVFGGPFRKMVAPRVFDKVGCVHAELMRASDAAARYTLKEGSKRYQKYTQDPRWREGGGAWFRASRGFSIPEFGDIMVSADDVRRCKFTTASGFEVDAPYRIQHGRGINGSKRDER